MRVKMKYDCNKTLDFLKEKARMCNMYSCCLGCPFATPDMECAFSHNMTQEHIDIVQRWSDDHPEMPKLTKKEYEFLSAFPYSNGMLINRTGLGLRLIIYRYIDGESYIYIDNNMFPFIDVGEEWDFGKLLSLEVIE